MLGKILKVAGKKQFRKRSRIIIIQRYDTDLCLFLHGSNCKQNRERRQSAYRSDKNIIRDSNF
jgi:hypothetical protein